MKHEDYHINRVKLQRFQVKMQFFQVLIQAVTLICSFILLGYKL